MSKLLHTAIVSALFFSLPVSSVWTVATAKAKADGADVVWRIGQHNGISAEFASGQRNSMRYVVGESNSAKNFPATQYGSLYPSDGKIREHRNPYSIIFDKPSGSDDNYRLIVYLYYKHVSPSEIEITVNGRKGIYPVSHTRMDPSNDSQGNSVLLAKQKIVVPIKGDWLKKSDNVVTIVPLGLGRMRYDAVVFEKENKRHAIGHEPHLETTVFYHENDGKLTERINLHVPFTEPFGQGKATVHMNGKTIVIPIEDHGYGFGVLTKKIQVPAFSETQKATIDLQLGEKEIEVTQNITPEKKWRLYITPRVHNDVGYTTVQPDVAELGVRNFDRVLDLMDRYPSFQYDFENTHLVDSYLNSRTEKWHSKYYKYAKQGRVGNNVLFLNLLTGLSSGEELHRATYKAYKLHVLHGVPFNFASITDVPTSSWFIPTLLSSIGVHYFTQGSNQTRGDILKNSSLNAESPFYWEGMNGKKVLMWYSRTYHQVSQIFTPAGSTKSPVPISYKILGTTLPQFLTRWRREGYEPDAVMVYGATNENVVIPQDGYMTVISKWNKHHAYPKLIMATDDDYFKYITRHFKDKLPTYRGGGGAYWEDGAASTAKSTKLNRLTKQLVPVAETAASISSILAPRYEYKTNNFNEIWKNILFYDEHTWGSSHSISRPNMDEVSRQWRIKKNYADQASMKTHDALTRSFNRLSHLFKVKGDRLFAFNFQSWTRTNPVEVELDDGLYIVNLENNQPVPYEVVSKGDGFRKILFLAKDVPAMGYRQYAIRRQEEVPKKIHEGKDVDGWSAQNSWYILTVDSKTGGIKSLIDKETGKQLVDQDGKYDLNEYLYVSGGGEKRTKIVQGNNKNLSPGELTVNQPMSVRLVKNVSTPLGERIVLEAEAKNTPDIRITYQLYDNIKRVDIQNQLVKTKTLKKEAVYFSFPFNSKKPEMAYQIQNGWVRPTKDLLPGANMSWFTTRNLVRVKDGDYTMALSTPDAPLITLTHINRGLWPSRLKLTNGHVFSYVMNNYWMTNYKASQGGKFVFHYSITSGNNLNQVKLAHFDANTRSPVLIYKDFFTHDSANTKPEGPQLLSSVEGSFMHISNPHLQFVTLKKAQDGEGWILRLKNASSHSGTAKVSFPLFSISSAFAANGVEKDEKKIPFEEHSVTVHFAPNSFTTTRLFLSMDSTDSP